MNNKAIIFISAITFFAAGCNYSQSVNIKNSQTTSGKVSTFSVKEIVSQSNTPYNFKLRGYVLEKDVCPPCPNPGFCAPCQSNNYVIVADKFSGIKGFLPDEPRVKLFFKPHNDTFQLETLYDFTIVRKSNPYNPAVTEYWIEYYNVVPLEE